MVWSRTSHLKSNVNTLSVDTKNYCADNFLKNFEKDRNILYWGCQWKESEVILVTNVLVKFQLSKYLVASYMTPFSILTKNKLFVRKLSWSGSFIMTSERIYSYVWRRLVAVLKKPYLVAVEGCFAEKQLKLSYKI